MAAVGLVADVHREIAALEPEVAVAADRRLVAAAIQTRAGHLVLLAAVGDIETRFHLVEAGAVAALPAAAGFAGAAAVVIGANGVARRLADAVAVRRAGVVAAAVEAAELTGQAAIVRRADSLAILRFGADAVVTG